MTIQVVNNHPEPAANAGEAKPQPLPATDVAEQKEPAESDTAEPEAKEASEEPAEPEADEAEDAAEEPEKAKPKKKSGAQRLKERIALEKSRREDLEQRLAALEKGAGEKRPAESAQPQKTGEPNPDDFASHHEYVRAMAKWTAKEELRAEREEQEKSKLQSEQEKFEAAHNDRVKAFAEKTPDWDDALSEVEDVMFSQAALYAIKDSELSAQIIYELAKNREEAERISGLPPVAAAREIGKLEARLSAASDKPKVEPKKTTQAPKPLSPVGGKGVVEVSLENAKTQAEYEAIRRKQMKQRGSSWG
jgi:hypothetical protein